MIDNEHGDDSRAVTHFPVGNGSSAPAVSDKSRADLESLSSQITTLREALEPFAKFNDNVGRSSNSPKSGLFYAIERGETGIRELTIEDFRKARTALSETNSKEGQ